MKHLQKIWNKHDNLRRRHFLMKYGWPKIHINTYGPYRQNFPSGICETASWGTILYVWAIGHPWKLQTTILFPHINDDARSKSHQTTISVWNILLKRQDFSFQLARYNTDWQNTLGSCIYWHSDSINPQWQKKQCKYQEFLFEIKQRWQINKITVIPLIVSAMRVIPNMLNQNLTTPTLMRCLLFQVHKVITLYTCSTVRKFLSPLMWWWG